MCEFSIKSVKYSTDTGIKTVVKRWYDVHMTVYRSFSGLFLQRTVHVSQFSEKKKQKKALDHVTQQPCQARV